eukprot:scaffold2682_cov155-Amphora_coffeaeformis.AAC.2
MQSARGNERLLVGAILVVNGDDDDDDDDDDAGKYPAFRGNVRTVYSHPLSKGGAMICRWVGI